MVLILVTKQLTASGKTEGPVPEGAYRFYYYPTSNFYYDVAGERFVYTLDGGRTWEVQKAAAPQTAKTFKDRKVIDSPEPGVWKYNHEHRRKYGGLLTDYREPAAPEVALPAAYEENRKKNHWKKKEKHKGRGKQEKKAREIEDSNGGWKNFPPGLKEKFRKLGRED